MAEYPLATVGALVVSCKARVLLIQTHKWRGSWGVPGGKIAHGEHMVEALRREFLEETGLTLFDIHWGPVQEAVNSPEFYKPAHFILLNFIARSQHETVTLNDEAERYAWVTPDEASAYALNTPTRKLLEFYQQHGFSGQPLDSAEVA
jgi:8-oxo-dGTP pyrophosphatase MutT (NUDIX family)